MRLSRLIAALAAAALCFVGVVFASPASADTVYTTTAKLTAARTVGYYGQYMSIGGAVTDNTGSGPFANNQVAYLQRKAPGSTAWVNVASDTSPGYLYFPTADKFTGNATYRVYYTGGTYGNSPNKRTWKPSYSNEVTVRTYRVLNDKGVKKKKKLFIKAAIVPNFGGQKAIVQTYKCKKKNGKKKCTWKTYKKKRTKANGSMKVRIKGKNKQKFRVVAPGDANFLTTTGGVWQVRIYKYREARIGN